MVLLAGPNVNADVNSTTHEGDLNRETSHPVVLERTLRIDLTENPEALSLPERDVEGFGARTWPSQASAGDDLGSLVGCDRARLPGGCGPALEALLTRPFSPKELKGGRVKVYGCSPGVAVSIGLSLFVTLAVYACIRLLG